MATEYMFDEKGKVNPKSNQDELETKKAEMPLTTDQLQGKVDAATVHKMQQTIGNTSVQRFLAQRKESGSVELDEDTAANINQERGGGHILDEAIATKAGKAMGQDFSQVKVHTDDKADALSQQLGAQAFTTGNDIFFRDGTYAPATNDGQHLIAHELTHVVQQGAMPASVQGKMKVNDPDDQYEAEANQVADLVMAQPDTLQLQEEEELLQQQEEEELQLQEEEEEDWLA